MKLGLQNEGAGVSKYEKQRAGAALYIGVYSERFWKLMGLNILFLAVSLPVVTAGPAAAAAMYILKKYTRGESAYVWRDFWTAFAKNFRQALALGIFGLAAGAALALALGFYAAQGEHIPAAYALAAVCALMLALLVSAMTFAYLVTVTVRLPLSKIIKNAVIMAVTNPGAGIAALVPNAALTALAVFLFPLSLVPVALMIPVTQAYIACCVCYPIVRRILVKPGEKNREQGARPEAVFSDTTDSL